jgi:glycosyltransferase involved in cell wall biosynthesis
MTRPDTSERTPLLSVVIPIRNEEAILWENASTLADALNTIVGAGRWRFVLVDNASTDATPVIIRKIVETWPPSFGVYAAQPNYGAALRTGLNRVDTPYAMVVDVEQSDEPFLAWAWRFRDEYDLFIGSRRADPSLSVRPRYRWFLSWGLNALLQLFFDFTGTETHGPKLIRMEHMIGLIALCVSDRGQYDTEIVLRAIRASRRVVEVPISSVEHRRPRSLMINKIAWNIVAFNRLRRILRDVPREGPVRYRRFTREDVLAVHAEFDLASEGRHRGIS